MNVSLLDNKDFHDQFNVLYERLSSLIDEYDDVAQWWEELAKPQSTYFCKDFSYHYVHIVMVLELFLGWNI